MAITKTVTTITPILGEIDLEQLDKIVIAKSYECVRFKELTNHHVAITGKSRKQIEKEFLALTPDYNPDKDWVLIQTF